jgi:hypothetical protein
MVWYGTERNGIIESQREEKGCKADGNPKYKKKQKKTGKQQNKQQNSSRLDSCHVTYSNQPSRAP